MSSLILSMECIHLSIELIVNIMKANKTNTISTIIPILNNDHKRIF